VESQLLKPKSRTKSAGDPRDRFARDKRTGIANQVTVAVASQPSRTAILIVLFLASIVPAALLLTCLRVREARGPLWLGSNSDPSYAYLFNSLLLTEHHVPTLVEHPGTVCQVLGAKVLTCVHRFRRPGRLVDDVLRDPEFYLNFMNTTLLLLYAAALAASGYLVWRSCGSWLAAAMYQLAPWASFTCLLHLCFLEPEPLLLTTSTVFGALVVMYVTRPNSAFANRFALPLGAVAALALGSKITALPLVIIGLVLLPGVRSRLVFLSIVAGGSFLVTLPILSKYIAVYDWFRANATHVGDYGSGATGLIDPQRYLGDLGALVIAEKVLTVTVTLSMAVIAMSWLLPACQTRDDRFRLVRRALAAVVLGQLVSFLIASKRPSGHYLMTSLGLVGLNLVLIHQLLRAQWYRAWLAHALVGGFLLWAGHGQWIGIPSEIARLEAHKQVQLRVGQECHSRYLGRPVIYFYRSSSLGFALDFGSSFSGQYFATALQVAHPELITYNIWSGSYYHFSERLSTDMVETLNRKAIWQGSPSVMQDPNYRPREVNLRPVLDAEEEDLFEPIRGADEPEIRQHPQAGTD